MKWLLLRPLSWIIGALGLALTYLQWKLPFIYPWPFVLLVAAYLAAGGFYAYGRLKFFDVVSRLLPGGLFIVAVALASLVINEPLLRMLLTAAAAFAPFFSLDLLYLALYEPARYPVNGLSRFNLALVPGSIFLLTAGLSGLQIFLPMQTWIVLLVLPLATAVLFLATSHPAADGKHRFRWTIMGAAVGLQAALLSVALPVALPVIGAVAAFIVVWPLRCRRYGYAPSPSARQAVIESCLHAGCFIALLFVSRWA